MTTCFTRCGINKPRLPAHDAAGRLTGYTHTTPGLNQSFDYDAQDRLSGITTPQGN